MTTRERFTVVVLDGHKGLAFEVPFSPAARWALTDEPLWPGATVGVSLEPPSERDPVSARRG